MKALVFFLSFLVLISCSDSNLTHSELIAKAQTEIQSGETRTAIIHLKNAIQKEPENKEARSMLGKQYLIIGSAKAAEKELSKAIELGGSMDDLLLDYGKSVLMQLDHKKISNFISQAKLKSDKQTFAANLIMGHVYLERGQIEKAKDVFGKITSGPYNHSFLQLGLARLNAFLGDKEKSIEHLQKVKKGEDDYYIAQIEMGNIQLSSDNLDASVTIFKNILDDFKDGYIIPTVLSANIGLIRAYIKKGELSQAETLVDSLLGKMRNQPGLNYLKASILFELKKYDNAIEYLHQVQKIMPDHMPSVLLMGAAQYAIGNYEQANNNLSRFVSQFPGHIHGRKLLAITRVKLNRTHEAINVLKGGVSKGNEDNELLTMIARLSAATGNFDDSQRYINRIDATTKDKNIVRNELANLYLRKGSIDKAIDELGKVTGDGQLGAKYKQINLYLKKGDYEKALSMAKEIANTEKDVMSYILLGNVYILSGEVDAAIQQLNKALRVQPDSILARLNLIHIYMQSGQYAQAEININKVLEIDSKNTKAMLGMAQLAEVRGDKDQAIKWVEKIKNIDNKNLSAYAILVKYYLSEKNSDKALVIAKEAKNNTNNSINASRLLAGTYMEAGMSNEAINIYKEILKSKKDIKIYQELAGLYAKEKKYKEAKSILQKAERLEPNNIQPRLAQALLEEKIGNSSRAIDVAKKIQKDFPKHPAGYMFVGDLYFSNQKYAVSIKEYDAGVVNTGAWQFYLKLSNVYLKLKKRSKAISILKKGLSKYPNNVKIVSNLAGIYLSAGDLNNARNYYELTIKQNPKDVIALNNLANIISQKDKATALQYSGKAYSLNSKSPEIMDTHGWLLVETHSVEDGKELLQQAVKSSSNPTIHYHYAVALSRSGSNEQAVSILQGIKGKNFPERNDANKLLQKISK